MISVYSQTIIAPGDKIHTSVIKRGKALVPIRKVSSGRVFDRFHDTSPHSPSGKFMALFLVPFEDRYPKPGEAGEVILVDMKSGKERVVATSDLSSIVKKVSRAKNPAHINLGLKTAGRKHGFCKALPFSHLVLLFLIEL